MAQYTPSAVKPPTGTLADDGDLQPALPRICVDYLSHQWAEEDVWRSWRNMTRHKFEISNGLRLENASWRTWWKQRNKLKTVSPETLNWLKDSDVTWLYGPLHTSNVDPVPKPKEATAMDKLNVDSQTKPILKHRSISDILALGALPPRPPPLIGSPLYEEPAIEGHTEEPPEPPSPTEEHLEHASVPPDEAVLRAPSRPPLWHTKSDSIVLRNRLSTSPDPKTQADPLSPPQRKTPSLSPPGRFTSRKSVRSDSSSSAQHSDTGSYGSSTTHGGGRERQNDRPRRHISFNSFVEQRIVIDPPTILPTVHSRSLSDSGSEDDEQLEMKSLSSSSSLTSRRLSSGSRSSINTTTRIADAPPKLSMITAPFPPALLKEAVDLPAPSPAVFFVPPSGMDQQALEYQLMRAAGSNGVRSPCGFLGAGNASPITLNRSPELVGASEGDWSCQEKLLDYFSGVPVRGSGRHHSRRLGPPEVDGELLDGDELVREPVYTDEDTDAITVRRRRSAGSLRRGRSGSGSSINGSDSGSVTAPPIVATSNPGQSPLAGAVQSSNSINLVDKPSSSTGTQGQCSSSAPSEGGPPAFGGISAPATRGRAGPLPRSTRFDLGNNGGTTSALGGRSQSYNGGGERVGFGGIVRNGSSMGVTGGTPSSGGSGGAPPFESRGRTMNGTGGGVGNATAEEPPRRGRSLLRTASSSSISERERSSTGGSSASPIGSLSPRPCAAGIIGSGSVGIIGGRDSSSLGIVGRGRGGSSLRYESGSWSRSRDASEEDGNGDDGDDDDEEEEEEIRREFVKRPSAASPIRRNGSGPSLVRTSSSSQIVPRGGAGLVRSHSSAGGQDGLFSSPHVGGTLPPPPAPPPSKPSVRFNAPLPSSSVRPPPRPPTPGGKRGRAMHLDLNEIDEKESGDSTTNSPSPWSASEFAVPWRERPSLELDSSVTPPSPTERRETPVASNSSAAASSGPTASPLPALKLPTHTAIRPKASGASLISVVSAESNGSASSAATVVPIPSRINELRSPHHVTQPHPQTDHTSPVISASSSISPNVSAVLNLAPEQLPKKDSPISSKVGTKAGPPKAIVSPSTKSLAPKATTAPAVAVGSSSPSPSAMTVTRNAAKRHSGSLSGSSSKDVSSSSISSSDEPRSPQRMQSPPLSSPNGVLAGVVGHAKNFFGSIWGGGVSD